MRALFISNTITTKDDESLHRYFNDIKKINLISPNEELSLAARIQKGEIEALNLLVKINLRFVISVAKQYQSRGVSICDLINEGNLGLIHAAKRFDETKGYKFISFAVWSVRQAIITALAEQSRMIHIPYNQTSLMGKLNKGIDKLEQQYSRKPTIDEVAEYLDVAPEKIQGLPVITGKEVSLDRPLGQELTETLLDIIPSAEFAADRDLIKDSQRCAIKQSLHILSSRERMVIEESFGLYLPEPIAMEEIAKKINLTVVQTRRVRNQALNKLRNSSYAAVLRAHLS